MLPVTPPLSVPGTPTSPARGGVIHAIELDGRGRAAVRVGSDDEGIESNRQPRAPDTKPQVYAAVKTRHAARFKKCAVVFRYRACQPA